MFDDRGRTIKDAPPSTPVEVLGLQGVPDAGDVKELGIVIKADVQGSVEVLSEMLPKLSTDQVKLKIIGSGVGAVTENDVLLASASGAIVIAFGIRPDRKAME